MSGQFTHRQLLELTDGGDPLARQAYALYEASFPEEERDPLEEIEGIIREHGAGDVREGRARHFCAALEDGAFAGLAIYGYYGPARLGFLAYLATVPGRRGRGLGAWILRQVLERLPLDAGDLGGGAPLGLCWEVERVEDARGSDERSLRSLRARRIEFYRRQGAVLLDAYPFVAPPLGPGLPAVPYHLMFMPALGQDAAVDGALLRGIVDAVMLGGYGQAPGSPYYRAAIAALPDDGGA